jgi:hypothetical protein
MIRVSANLSKKVPLPNKEFSMVQCGGSLEIEISDADQPDHIKAKVAELYRLLDSAVEDQIKLAVSGTPMQASSSTAPSNGRQHAPVNRTTTSNAASTKRGTLATAAQVRAIHAISTRNGVELASVLGEYGVSKPEDLTVKSASALIDRLKK